MAFKLACGQFTPTSGDLAANTQIMEEQMASAAEKGAEIIVFPELALSGYLPPEEIAPLAVSIDGAEVTRLRQAAREAGIAIAFGFAEAASDGHTYNSMAYFDAGGRLLHTYHKVHLWDSEKQWAAPGDGISAFDTGRARAGMWICYDTRFPEMGRLLAVDGATLALVATAWLGPADEWELGVRARAMDNGLYVAAGALQGNYGPYRFHGASLIVDPHGQVLAQAAEGTDEVIVAEYDRSVVDEFRQRVPLLEHRRLDTYGPLLRPATW